jgi:hypothetical protein
MTVVLIGQVVESKRLEFASTMGGEAFPDFEPHMNPSFEG